MIPIVGTNDMDGALEIGIGATVTGCGAGTTGGAGGGGGGGGGPGGGGGGGPGTGGNEDGPNVGNELGTNVNTTVRSKSSDMERSGGTNLKRSEILYSPSSDSLSPKRAAILSGLKISDTGRSISLGISMPIMSVILRSEMSENCFSPIPGFI